MEPGSKKVEVVRIKSQVKIDGKDEEDKSCEFHSYKKSSKNNSPNEKNNEPDPNSNRKMNVGRAPGIDLKAIYKTHQRAK